MPELITPAEALFEALTDLIEESECGLFEAVGVLDVVKTELKLAFLAADEDEAEEAEGEFESDGVVGE
jgi:hypothetical protein